MLRNMHLQLPISEKVHVYVSQYHRVSDVHSFTRGDDRTYLPSHISFT